MSKFRDVEYSIKTQKLSNAYDFYIDYKDGSHGIVWASIEPLRYSKKCNKFIQNHCINLSLLQFFNWKTPQALFDKKRQIKGLEQHLTQQITKIILKKETKPIYNLTMLPKSKDMQRFTKKHKWKQIKNTNLFYLPIKQMLKARKGER